MPIHPTAAIDPSARVHESADIGPHAYVGAEAEIGEGCVLMHGVSIAPRTVIGAHTRLHYHAAIGGDPQYLGFDPSTDSRVRVGERCELRENATIHRGLKDGAETVVGDRVMIMNGGHVGHDCTVGNDVVIAACALLAGHVAVEERAFISGLVVVHQYCRIGKLAMLGGQAGVGQDVPPYTMVQGASGAGRLTGLNTVGMRRGGVGPEARTAIRSAFKTLFLSGLARGTALARIGEEWAGRDMPAELASFLDFMSVKSKRGFMGAFVAGREASGEE